MLMEVGPLEHCAGSKRSNGPLISAVVKELFTAVLIVGRSSQPEHAMAMRTSKRTVTFVRPFTLGGSSVEFPAGRYFVETDEDRVDELSFPFYRRTATIMQLIADPLHPGVTETAVIDPLDLEAALKADAMTDAELENSHVKAAAEGIIDTESKAAKP
jgi:hypothetical protein